MIIIFSLSSATQIGLAKEVTLFNDRIIVMEKEYARQLLTHENSYTNNRYINEPALAIVEIVNENSLTEAWFDSRLLGEHADENTTTWPFLPLCSIGMISARLQQSFSADDSPIPAAQTLILAVTARSGFTGMKWNDERTSLRAFGIRPATIEVVKGKVILSNLHVFKHAELQYLDGNGLEIGKKVFENSNMIEVPVYDSPENM